MKLELKVTPKGNPVINKKEMGIENVYAHIHMPNLCLWQNEQNTIVKPHKGILIQFLNDSTLYRVIKQRRKVIIENGEVVKINEYSLDLAESSVTVEDLQYNSNTVIL